MPQGTINERTYAGFRRTTGDASRVDVDGYRGSFTLLVPTTGRDLHFASAADENTDWNVANPTDPRFYVHSETTSATNYVYLSHNGTNGIFNSSTALLIQVAEATVLTVAATLVTSDEDVVIASGNGLNVGSATQLTVSDGDGVTDLIPEVQAIGVGTAFAGGAVAIATFNTTNDRTVSPKLALVKGGAATQVATTIVADNEVVGSIIAYGSDGVDFESPVGAIEFVIDGTPGAGDMPGSIEFYTTADAGETLTLVMTLNSAQNVIVANNNGVVIGHTAQLLALAETPEFQMHGTAAADSFMLLTRWSADVSAPIIMMAKSRNAAIGTFSIITSGDILGMIGAIGDDGVDFNANDDFSAQIRFVSSGTIAADRVPGQIEFWTATNAAPSVETQRVLITNAGLVDMLFTARIGLAGTRTGSLGISGATSGTVTVTVAAAAGTWTMQLPAAVGAAGQQLTDAAGDGICTWAAASLREWKIDRGILDPHEALRVVVRSPTHKFNFNPAVMPPGQWAPPDLMSGVFADEAPWAMHGERASETDYTNGVALSTINSVGYLRASIQGLYEDLQGALAEVATLKSRLAAVGA